jgi:peptidoglycan/LPS O-acetylase OafA/YrhL
MSHRFLSIQVVRAIAALSVVLFHSHFAVAAFEKDHLVTIPFVYQWGYLGVDLFFVVSGFIIAHITSRQDFRPIPFLVRRFFRIYPLYWVFSGLAVWLYLASGYNLGGGDFSLFGFIKAFAIFPLEPHPPYAVGWTLEHEIIFYLIAAIVVAIAGIRALACVLFLLGGVGLVLSVLTASGIITKFWDFHVFSQANIYFLSGLLVYQYQGRLLRLGVGWPLLGTAVGLWFFVNLTGAVPGAWRTVAVTAFITVASSLFIVALLNAEKLYAEGRWWSHRAVKVVVLIGNASFSLYLVHWVLAVESGRMKWKIWFALPEWSAEFYRFGIVALSIMIALALYRFAEKPLIAWGHVLAGRF